MNKYTAGPWVCGDLNSIFDTTMNNKRVATIFDDRPREEIIANADLISKAPEMLDLLRKAYECIVYPDTQRNDTVETFKRIHALIKDLDGP